MLNCLNVSMHKYITSNLEYFGFHALFADFNNNLWAAKQRVMHIAAMNRQTNTQKYIGSPDRMLNSASQLRFICVEQRH